VERGVVSHPPLFARAGNGGAARAKAALRAAVSKVLDSSRPAGGRPLRPADDRPRAAHLPDDDVIQNYVARSLVIAFVEEHLDRRYRASYAPFATRKIRERRLENDRPPASYRVLLMGPECTT